MLVSESHLAGQAVSQTLGITSHSGRKTMQKKKWCMWKIHLSLGRDWLDKYTLLDWAGAVYLLTEVSLLSWLFEESE